MQMAFLCLSFRCHHPVTPCLHLCVSLGNLGRMGARPHHLGWSLLQEIIHQRFSGFQQSRCANPTNPDSWCPHYLPSPPPHTANLSLGSDDSTCFIWLVFLPFSLPLPPRVSVQECFHLGPRSPCENVLWPHQTPPFLLSSYCAHNNLSENPSLTSVALLKSKHLSRHRL